MLNGSHKNLECNKCHKSEFMTVEKLRKKSKTFLGLDTKCKTCHEDVHQGTLGNKCSTCHNEVKFKPAMKFSHDDTKFILTGKHQNVDCEKCHVKERRNNKQFQKFADVKFSSCKDCHNDFHKGKFGDKCQSCHNTNSFNDVEVTNGFDHSKTNFPLIGKHKKVKCESCHKGSLKSKPKFTKCYYCHEDYHKGEFITNNIQLDCKKCHNEYGFSPAQYSVEMHNQTGFKLEFAHEAIPCMSCHLINLNWTFKINGGKCIDCHKNIHGDEISVKYFDKEICESCHTTVSWSNIHFDHDKTDFALLGKHSKISCRDCHFTYKGTELVSQKFIQLSTNCTQCHTDIHNGQFTENGKELCLNCHTSENWKPTLFDHSKTRFQIDGAHQKVKCAECHKQVTQNQVTFTKYKIEDVRCISCHS